MASEPSPRKPARVLTRAGRPYRIGGLKYARRIAKPEISKLDLLKRGLIAHLDDPIPAEFPQSS